MHFKTEGKKGHIFETKGKRKNINLVIEQL